MCLKNVSLSLSSSPRHDCKVERGDKSPHKYNKPMEERGYEELLALLRHCHHHPCSYLRGTVATLCVSIQEAIAAPSSSHGVPAEVGVHIAWTHDTHTHSTPIKLSTQAV